MLKPSPIVFSEMRNMKRNQTTLNCSAKDVGPIMSAKQIKKSRSSKQIDVTTFMETKNEKIKNIDEKLQVHQSEITKNSHFIEELNQNFLNLRDHLIKEKQATQSQERKNKLLREEIQRTNKILKSKNSKIQEYAKKITDLQKENEILKPYIIKNQQYAKTISNLRSKFATTEELISQLKQNLSQKEKEALKQKQKTLGFEVLKSKQEELDNQILMRDEQIRNLKLNINQLYSQKNKQTAEKNTYLKKIESLEDQIQNLKQKQLTLSNKASGIQKKFNDNKTKFEKLQAQYKQRELKLKDKESQETSLKQLYADLKAQLNTTQNQVSQKNKVIQTKQAKILKLTQKIKDLENVIGESYKEKDKLKSFQQKIGLLKQKANSLQSVYYSIVPQIQCPFGHQLRSPVTIIPCGHNYCLGCKKGYQKDCMQCSGKLKIQAVYRNQLMDDIIGIVGGIKSVIEILK